MADSYDTLQLLGRHVPDPNSGPFTSMDQAQEAGYDTMTPVTGQYQFGALVDGQFVVLLSEKASNIFGQIDAGKAADAAAAEAAAAAAPAAAPAPVAPPPAESMTGSEPPPVAPPPPAEPQA